MMSKGPQKKVRSRVRAAIFSVPAMLGPLSKMRVFFHKLRGVNIGNDVEIGYHVIIDNVYPERVTIEDGATIAARTTILAHDESALYTGIGEEIVRNTRICEGAFVGVHSVILAGVTVGRKAIVGAGSVVIKDVPDNARVAGVPAKQIS
ncbi:MAG: acyltransferase [Methanomassiliicoccales archaeon]|nr:MAG: acyltransferase [Methanomassiliicoccales archaeon]